ncbi:MAG: hypothetical protein KDA81_17810 [Planctomycetaceae bacterium]|nr:hypothetical protein [Planctomycetaceae bacterium]
MSVLSIGIVGCSQPNLDEMSGASRAPYPEFDQLNDAPLMSVAYPAEMGDLAASKKAAGGEEFEKAVAAFEASSVPAGYDSAAKDGLVAALKDLIETGKNGKAEEIKDKLAAVTAASAKLAAK